MTAPLRDPVGLLERSPELAAIAEHLPSLRKAIESGRPFDAYRALFWGSKLGKLKGEQADVAKALLEHRRVFFKRLTGAPTMFTYNGVGSSLYGRSDVDPNDGTYVATLYLVFIFIPVFPIGSYLVRDATNGGRRAWSFMAKVPLATLGYLWQRSIAVGILATIAFGAANAFEGYGHNTLYVVNGLDHGVTVDLSESGSMPLSAGGHVAIRTTAGAHTIAIHDGPLVLESSTVDVPRGHDTVAWNVLGAAPLYVANVVYTSSKSPPPDDKTDLDVMCGKSTVVRSGIDYPFEEPPKEMSMPEHQSSVTKTHMDVAPGGVGACADWLISHGKGEDGAHLALSVARANKTPAAKFPEEFEQLVMLASKADAESFTKDLLARDDSLKAHRLYQNYLMATDQRARAISEYEARRASHPNDADAEYLALRVQPLEEERKTVDAVVEKYPTHGYLRRSQLYVHYEDLELDRVVAAAEALRKIDAALWLQSIDAHVESLVATDRGKDALDLASGVAKDAAQEMSARRNAEILAFRVAHRIGAPEPKLTLERDDSEALPLFVRAIAGLELARTSIDSLKDDVAREALLIARAARQSPDNALTLVEQSSERSVHNAPQAVRILLVGEAVRKAKSAAYIEKLVGGSLPKGQIEAVVTYVKSGVATDEITELPLELRAALDFARSRMSNVTPEEKKDRLARATSSDVLHGPVTVAIQGWPPS